MSTATARFLKVDSNCPIEDMKKRIKILKMLCESPADKVFYAADYSFNAAMMTALKNYHFITSVGVPSKDVFIPMYNDMYKKVEVKGWKLARSPEELRADLFETLQEYIGMLALELVDL